MKRTRSNRRPTGITALAWLFLFGVFASGSSALSLFNPGTSLDIIWQVKPQAHATLVQLGVGAALMMCAVCVACALAGFGFVTGATWGYRLGVAILLLNLAGDLVNMFHGAEAGAWIGVPIVTLLLWYLRAPVVQAWFAAAPPDHACEPKPPDSSSGSDG